MQSPPPRCGRSGRLDERLTGAAAPVEEDRQEEQATRARPSAVQRLGIQRFAILIVFAALVVAFGAAIPSTFLSIGNLSNILGSQAVPSRSDRG